MQLSDTAIQEYIQLYREDFGEELTVGDARAIATRLMTLYQLLCRPSDLPLNSQSHQAIGNERGGDNQ